MKKLKSKSGMTLFEMLAALFITVLLIVAMGTGMSAATDIYDRAAFAADSNALANVLSTSISDILRYATNISHPDGDEDRYSFTSYDYGVQNATLDILEHNADLLDTTKNPEKKEGKVVISFSDGTSIPLVNDGVYSMTVADGEDAVPEYNLAVKDFLVKFVGSGEGDSGGGGYFDVSFKIFATKNTEKEPREVRFCVRVANLPS